MSDRTSPFRGLVIVVAVVTMLASCAGAPREHARADGQAEGYGKPIKLTELTHQAVRESSGLAHSPTQEGVFWTHNDSGDGPYLYAFDRKGRHLGRFVVEGAEHKDWEDIASFQMDGKSWLLIGDCGDNQARRESITLYLVKEPQIDREHISRGKHAELVRTIRVRYPDGPRDCEAVAVDTVQRKILLTDKRLGFRSRVYATDLSLSDETDELVTAKPIATIIGTLVTAMDISPDGRRMIVAGYGSSLEYRRAESQNWAEALAGEPRIIRLPPRRQGESICYGPDGWSLYLTSEHLPTPLWQVPHESSDRVEPEESPRVGVDSP